MKQVFWTVQKNWDSKLKFQITKAEATKLVDACDTALYTREVIKDMEELVYDGFELDDGRVICTTNKA